MPIFGGTSSAKARFERIRAEPDPFSYLAGLVNPSDPVSEEEWLDFKGKPRDDHDAKKIWSKALAGYANITDGLLIWGIDARKDEATGRDVAVALRLIEDPIAFKGRLRELQPDATNAPVMGVEIEAYPGTGDGPGFVVCFVPESAHKPHRAEFADRQWYYRAGTNFKPAEPGLLRTLFYPQRSTRFDLEVTLSCRFQGFIRPAPRAEASLRVSAVLKVEGSATARDVYVTMRCEWPSLDVANRIVTVDWDSKGHGRNGYGFAARRSLHPGEECTLFHDAEEMVKRPATWLGDFDYALDVSTGPFRFAVHAADQERQLFEADFSGTTFTQRPGGGGHCSITKLCRRIS